MSWPRSDGEHRFTEMYERSRIRLSDKRAEIRASCPYTPPFNKWSANVPGSTYFVPVSEMTGLYLTILFASLGQEFAYFFHDDKDPLMRPAGLDRFAKSKGGVLHDDVQGRPRRHHRRARDLSPRAVRRSSRA